MLVCTAGEKPLLLMHILRDTIFSNDDDGSSSGSSGSGQQYRSAVVFTASVESTHRLTRLLQLFGQGATEYSSSLPQAERLGIIRRMKQQRGMGTGMGTGMRSTGTGTGSSASTEMGMGEGGSHAPSVLVCSDAMARGMDLPSVDLVVNYDAPSHIKTYVHRIGRTARAGRAGTAVTMLKQGQLAGFRAMLQKTTTPVNLGQPQPQPQPQTVGTYPVRQPEQWARVSALVPRYSRCLRRLEAVLEKEKAGRLRPTTPVPPVPDADRLDDYADADGDGEYESELELPDEAHLARERLERILRAQVRRRCAHL